ncbi:hypothetical protein MBLNU459_g8384t1 [Dothideomycetes sp. NU459]
MNVQASCAICGAPPSKQCGHENERLKIALFDAQQRWIQDSEMSVIRHADYVMYKGSPPISAPQMYELRAGINAADRALQSGIDADWQASLQKYPEVLDHFFSLVELTVPSEKALAHTPPQFGSKKRRNSGEKHRHGKHRLHSVSPGATSAFPPGSYPPHLDSHHPGF